MVNEIHKASNTPGLLVRLGFTPVIQLSTLGHINVFGSDWESHDIKQSGDHLQQSIKLHNNDFRWSELLEEQFEGTEDITCDVWQIYRLPTGEYESYVAFSGTLATANDLGDKVTLVARALRPDMQQSPRVVWQSHYAIAPGTEITINNEIFKLESQ